MKPLRLILLICFIIYQHFPLTSQILSEGFESGYTSLLEGDWSEEPDENNEYWKYRNGGHNPSDLQWVSPDLVKDLANNPDAAHTGNSNAIFFLQSYANERTKLVTPEMNLEGGTRIELSFWLCQVPWYPNPNDVLRIYYRTHADNDWILLHEYLDPVYEWELQTLVLPNLSSTYYVAFEGHTRFGNGTCIDDVVIEEKGIQHVWISEIGFRQQFINSIPSGSDDVPMMRIDFKVFGNDDTAKLEQIHFSSLNISDDDLKANGVKLYSTTTQVFSTDDPLGSPTNFNGSGIASFTGLDYSLPRGQSYVWLTYDVDAGAVHGNILDVKVAASGILANDTLYPSTDQSPDGYRTIYETRYFEDFEGTPGWTLTGEFQIGTPSGGGGSSGNPDPTEAFSGTKVLGTDLSGIAPYPYDYEPNLSESGSYLATSTAHNMFFYKNLNLFFYRFLNIDVNDEANIQVSSDNGTSWHTVWESGASFVLDYNWELQQVPVPDVYSRTDQFKFRFKLGPTNDQSNYSGWNIDDLYLTGEFISKDVGVSEWIYPLSGSGHSSSDSVTLRITNYGGAEITDPVPVAYSFNGGTTWKQDNLTQSIPVGGSVVFTLPTKVDLSVPGLYPDVLARTNLPGDQFPANDQISTDVYIVPTHTPPHSENFESNDGYWRSSGNDLWEYGTPAGSVINSASSGTKSWATGLTLKYDDIISQKDNVIFEDDFEDDLGWTLEGQFQRAQPSTIHPPYYPITPYYCLGTDLTGLIDSLYKYENNITEGTAYTATTLAFDVSAYSNLTVSYFDNINIQAGDSIRLEVSPDNGANWYTLWKNTEGEILNDWLWESREFILHDSLSGSTALKIRFSLFYSSASGNVSYGWNIDNFLLTGDLVNSAPGNLTSPSYDLSGMDNPIFEAGLWWDTEPGVDGATLLYSLDDGDTWTPISNSSGYDSYWNWYTGNPVSELSLDGWSGQSGDWLTVKHFLPAAVINQENVQFRLSFVADKFNNQYDGIALDDVHISEAPEDAGVLAIIEPSSACDLSAKETFNLRIKNYGIRDMLPGDSIRIGYYIEREGEVQTAEETIILTQSLNVGGNQYFDMATEFDFSKSGYYNIAAYTIEMDPYYYQSVANDTATKVVWISKPAVELGPDIATVRPDTVTLSAYSGDPTDDYLWQDEITTDSVFHVSVEGTYYVRVENDIGCAASDTIRIIKLTSDLGVTALLGLESDCELGSNVSPGMEIKNYGSESLAIGYKVPVGYSIDRGTAVLDTVILAEEVEPDSSFEYTFATGADLSEVKTYNVAVFVALDYDDWRLNDTLETSVEAYGYTPIDLGPDTVVRAFQHTIDAGAGYDTYLWQDESTGQTLMVDSTGWYRVAVTAGNQCENSDSLHVTFIIPDISIKRLMNPADACGLSAAERLEMYVVNSGTDTLNASDTILVDYQLDAGSQVFDTLYVDRIVEPGDSILFASSGIMDLSSPGTYLLTVNVYHSQDLIPDNNNLAGTVDVFGYPEVSLGPDRNVTATSDTLDPGSGYASYTWQDASTGQQYIVEYDNQTPNHSYSVIVTDENGCEALDDVIVEFDIWDIGIVAVKSPVTACTLSDQEELRVLVKNFGSNAILNEQVRIIASLDGGIQVTGQKTLTQALNPGDTLEFLFGHKFDLSGQGDHTMRTYSVYAKDAVPDNDTLEVTVTNQGGSLDIDIGNGKDSVGTTLPHTLDAGGDYVSYIWNGIAGSRTYLATQFGWYKLEVTDQQGCMGTDSVFLMLSTGAESIRLPGHIKIYPVPADNMLNVEYRYREPADHLFLDIFDSQGRKILVKQYRSVKEISESIDVSGLAKGIYFVKLRSDEQYIIRQIVIQ